MTMNPYELAQLAADELRSYTGVDTYDLAIVLGSTLLVLRLVLR